MITTTTNTNNDGNKHANNERGRIVGLDDKTTHNQDYIHVVTL